MSSRRRALSVRRDGPVDGKPILLSQIGAGVMRRGGFLVALLILASCAFVAMPALASGLTQVPGSPFPDAGDPYSVAFSPDGELLAAANLGADDVSVFSVSQATGALTEVPGSPFPAGVHPVSVAFSPDGGLLATANANSADVSVFAVDQTTGTLTEVPGSPFASGTNPRSVAFSPSGGLLATANYGSSGDVSVFAVEQTTGALTPVAGSPFRSSANPIAVAFSPSGGLLATANYGGGQAAVFAVDQTSGALTEVLGSPFGSQGSSPYSVAFSPGGGLLALSNLATTDVSVYSVNQTTGALAEIPGSPFPTSGADPYSVAFSPGGGMLATANYNSNDMSVFSVNQGTGALAQLPGSPFQTGVSPSSVAFSPSGALLATANYGGSSVSVFSVSSGTTWYVATGGSDSNTCNTSASPCATVSGAVSEAASGDTISVGPGTFTDDVTIASPLRLTIEGEGTGETSLVADTPGSPVLAVASGAQLSLSAVTIGDGFHISELNNYGTTTVSDATLSDGVLYSYGTTAVAASTVSSDGEIYNYGTTTITGSTFASNGEVATEAGTTTVSDSTFASGGTSGYVFSGGGTTSVSDSTFYANGEVAAAAGTTTVSDSTFAGGYLNGSGGTISASDSTFSGGYVFSAGDTTTVSDSTFTGGYPEASGLVSIYTESGTTKVSNSTFSGGQVYTDSGTTTVSDSTFSGGDLDGSGGSTTVFGTILGSGCAGTIADGGYNLDYGDGGANSCGLSAASDVIEHDPLLAALQNNGGPTATEAITPASPAYHQIPAVQCPATDQRSVNRPQPSTSSSCDIGAFEWTGIYAAVQSYTDSTGTLVVSAPGLLTKAADTLVGNPTFTPILATEPANGSATINPDGSFSYTPNAGFTGTDSFTYTLRDQDGNVSPPATVAVAVVETTPPQLTLPADITVAATAPGGVIVTFTASAIDPVDGPVPVTCTPQSGSTFNFGDTTVHCSATDAHGNTASGSFVIHVLDRTPPVIVFAGNQGSYGLLDTVHITCSASDPSPGSGLAHDPCAGFLIAGPTWSFKPGVNTLPNPGLVATDNAGNSSAPTTTSFTVTVTPSSLCGLTVEFVQSSNLYGRLTAGQKKAVDLLTTAACQLVTAIVPRLNAAQKAIFVAGYKQAVAALAKDGWLTSNQATTLTNLVAAL